MKSIITAIVASLITASAAAKLYTSEIPKEPVEQSIWSCKLDDHPVVQITANARIKAIKDGNDGFAIIYKEHGPAGPYPISVGKEDISIDMEGGGAVLSVRDQNFRIVSVNGETIAETELVCLLEFRT